MLGRSLPLLLTLALATPVVAQSSADSLLLRAQGAWERHPTNADSIIWYGRRVGYTGDFTKAVAIYTAGIKVHPNDARLYRHRGHRYISLRDFDRAIADLETARALVAGTADQVEPDGQPNARGIPTSTLHSNIRYHLALAYYLAGNFRAAEPIWNEDVRLAANVDQRVAATYWWVLTMARMGISAGATRALSEVRADWDIIENGSYHRLLLWMRGDLPLDRLLAPGATALEQATIWNGVGQWHLAAGRTSEARMAFRRALAPGPSASFGAIAAETALTAIDGGAQNP